MYFSRILVVVSVVVLVFSSPAEAWLRRRRRRRSQSLRPPVTSLTTPLNGKMGLVSGHGSCDRRSEESTVGYWTLNQPLCNVNGCSFPNITNGSIKGCNGDSASYGDSCEFHCDLGQMSPSGQRFRVRQCQADTSWSGSDFQCTERVRASPIGSPPPPSEAFVVTNLEKPVLAPEYQSSNMALTNPDS